MLTRTELYRHTWDSSRTKNENFISFSLTDEGIVISYSCLWDAREDIVDDGEVTVSTRAFVETVRSIPKEDGVGNSVQGVAKGTNLSFTRQSTEADVFCNWGNGGGNVLVPITKLLELCGQL